MKSLLTFELYKIFRQKSIYIALIVLLGLITISLNSQTTVSSNSSYYKEWEGQLTEEKYERAEAANLALMGSVSEEIPLTQEEQNMLGVYENISFLHALEEDRQASVGVLSERLHLQEADGEAAYAQRRTALELRMLEQLEINKLYYNRAPSEMIDFVRVFGFLISGALILIGLAPIFSNEYTTGMDQFQLSSKYGRKRDVTAKIIASLIYVIFVIGIWAVYNALHRIAVYGEGGWKSPIQQLFKYRDSPYAYDMLPFIGVQIGMHALGAFGLAMFVLLISALCRNTLLSFLISGFVFALPIAVEEIFRIKLGSLGVLIEFSYTSVMIVYDLFATFQTINVFGMPMLYPIVAVAVTIALSALCMQLLYWTMKRKEVA
jgi:ABC-type transport system involved in multi-copper enzyme maturation permease subunit